MVISSSHSFAQLDGWIARKWKVKSVLGSILDPAADKALMTTLVGTLAWVGLLPRQSPFPPCYG